MHYSMSRAAFFSKLREVAPELLPFVPLFYGSPSTCCWWDSTGRCRDVAQGESCEQGDSIFFFLHAPFRLSSAVPVHEYNGLRAGSGRWQAACEQGAASACGEDFVEVGHHSRLAIVSTRRQLKQRRREGAHGGDSQDAGPALDPSCTCSSPERRREAGVGARLRLAGARDRADDYGIERELRSVPERQAVGDDLDAPRVAHRDVDVQVSDPDVACNARASLPTDAGDGMLVRKGSRCQDTGRSARRAVVTKRVEAAAAAADARRQGDPEVFGRQGDCS